MDEFLKVPEECIAQAREMKPEEGFLGKDLGETASNGLQILEEKKQKIWKIIAISLQGADFLQIINPSYMTPVIINVGREKLIGKMWG